MKLLTLRRCRLSWTHVPRKMRSTWLSSSTVPRWNSAISLCRTLWTWSSRAQTLLIISKVTWCQACNSRVNQTSKSIFSSPGWVTRHKRSRPCLMRTSSSLLRFWRSTRSLNTYLMSTETHSSIVCSQTKRTQAVWKFHLSRLESKYRSTIPQPMKFLTFRTIQLKLPCSECRPQRSRTPCPKLPSKSEINLSSPSKPGATTA